MAKKQKPGKQAEQPLPGKHPEIEPAIVPEEPETPGEEPEIMPDEQPEKAPAEIPPATS